jgi:hypothetical protein
MDLAMSDTVSLMEDVPCLAETRRDLEGVLVEGPALMVQVCLRLVGCGDVEGEILGEIRSSSLLEREIV